MSLRPLRTSHSSVGSFPSCLYPLLREEAEIARCTTTKTHRPFYCHPVGAAFAAYPLFSGISGSASTSPNCCCSSSRVPSTCWATPATDGSKGGVARRWQAAGRRPSPGERGLERLRPRGSSLERRSVIAQGMRRGDPSDGFSSSQHSLPEDVFEPFARFSGTENIGAAYGEGFLRFRLSGELTRLDVDSLNEQLRIDGPDRLRHAMCPDEAFGLLFEWDDVVFDARSLVRKAWREVADAQGLEIPSLERPQLYNMSPDRAVMDVMGWTRDIGRARELGWMVSTAYSELVRNVRQPIPGARQWLELMAKTQVPCALLTNLKRSTTIELLRQTGMDRCFTALVTADEDMETIAQRYLTAAIKLNRPPNHCVVFGSTPAAIAAAHNCTMKSVAVVGAHTAPELRTADLTVGSLTELSVINVRRLFANRGFDFMELRKSKIGAPGTRERRLRNAIRDPGEF